MALWLILGAMTVIAVGLVLVPLVRRARQPPAPHLHDLGVYRAQLDELERDRALGLLDEAEAGAARLEIQRRILALGGGEAAALTATGEAPLRRLIAPALLLALPLVAGLLYGLLGNPSRPAAPFAAREAEVQSAGAGAPGAADLASVETLLARLEERVRTVPGDLEGWVRLGQAHMMLERYDEAAADFARAVALDDQIAGLHAAEGEALAMAAGGIVTGAAGGAFERALAVDPAEPRATFYTGLAALQRGERERALQLWQDLASQAPPEAPFLPELRRRIAALAEELGRAPGAPTAADAPTVTGTPTVTGAPTEGAAAAGGGRDGGPPPPTTEAEARALAARLADRPDDWQGWIALARGWAALGDPAEARSALTRGAEAYAGAPFVLSQFEQVAVELGLDDRDGEPRSGARPGPSPEQMQAARDMAPDERDAMIRSMVEGLAARLETEPDDVEGWRMLGRSWRVLGEVERSVSAFARVAELRPDDLEAQLDYADALVAQGGGAPSGPAVTQLERVLALDPDHPDALFLLGHAAAAEGDRATARRHWQRLLAQLPAGAPEQVELRRLLDGLDSED